MASLMNRSVSLIMYNYTSYITIEEPRCAEHMYTFYSTHNKFQDFDFTAISKSHTTDHFKSQPYSLLLMSGSIDNKQHNFSITLPSTIIS